MRITHEEIEQATAEFLANGGQIQRLSPTPEFIEDSHDGLPSPTPALLTFKQIPDTELPKAVLLPKGP
jgi:hypothetical protein